jgi:DNA polymerase elongation subunit (family B)
MSKKFYTNAAIYGNSILVNGWDFSENKSFSEKAEFRPTLYLPSNKSTKYKTIDGVNVSPINPGTIKESKQFLAEYKDVTGTTIYGMERFLYQYLAEEFEGEIDYDPTKVRTFCIDIETQSEDGFPNVREANEEILLISLKNMNTKEVFVFGRRPYTPTEEKVTYYLHENEERMLRAFIFKWQELAPDIVTGWNVQLFDMPYIMNRILRVLGEKDAKNMSPWKFYVTEEVTSYQRSFMKYKIYGLSILDYMDMYKKFTFKNRESYRLDTIAEVELGKKKLDHSEFNTFKDFYDKGWKKFVDYNIVDVHLVDELNEKLNLLELIMLMAYDAHCTYDDTFFQVRMWDIIIYNELRKKNIVVSPIVRTDKEEKYAGAYVKEPIPGSYDYVVSYDLNSLYPSLIRFLNISPETLTEQKINVNVDDIINKKCDLNDIPYAIAANGCTFDKSKIGFMPGLVRRIYDERVTYKQNMIRCKQEQVNNPSRKLELEISKWSTFQMVRKIQLNSLYGALGNQYFRYFRVDNAEAITLTGQVAIRWIERKINEFLNQALKTKEEDYVIASDTDSIYINLGPLVRSVFPDLDKDKSEKSILQNRIVEILNKFSEEKIVPFIDKSYDELSDYLNAYEKCLVMKRECIADRGIWMAKKRYILNVWDEEGVRYNTPKLKMMGIEAVKTSTPAPCRKYIKECIGIIMNGTEEDVIDYIAKKEVEFSQLNPTEIAFPRSVTDMQKFYTDRLPFPKGTPYHVKAALMYNMLVKKNNLQNKYSLIQNGEKIKFLYLLKQNPVGVETIGFINEYPSEFGLTNYLDFHTMYEKSFIAPMKTILNIIGWHTEKTNSLSDFFL